MMLHGIALINFLHQWTGMCILMEHITFIYILSVKQQLVTVQKLFKIQVLLLIYMIYVKQHAI